MQECDLPPIILCLIFLAAWASPRQRVFDLVGPLESRNVPCWDGARSLPHTTAPQRRNRHGDEATPSRDPTPSAKRKSVCITCTCHSNAHIWAASDNLLKCKFEICYNTPTSSCTLHCICNLPKPLPLLILRTRPLYPNSILTNHSEILSVYGENETLKYSTCACNDVWSHSFSYPHSLQKEAKDRGEMKVLLVSFTVYRITNILLVKNLCEWAKSAENLTLCDLTIAFWQGSCVFSSNNLGFIVANWSTIVKFANVWCSQSILVVLGIHMSPLLR